MLRWRILFWFLCFFNSSLQAATNSDDTLKTIKIHIIHGSKPAKGQKKEYKTIGGRYGGHIVIEAGGFMYGFYYKSAKIHVFPRQKKKNRKGIMEKQEANIWVSANKSYKITTIELPIDTLQYNALVLTLTSYYKEAPYDYAFWGMRCASSCYYTLSKIGVIGQLNKTQAIVNAFYPGQFRKKMLRIAAKNKYVVFLQKGKTTRKWEGD
jgi:hypothetical protein